MQAAIESINVAGRHQRPDRFRESPIQLQPLSTNGDLPATIAEQEKMLEIEIEKLPSYGIGLERGIMHGIEQGIAQGIEQGTARGARANAESLLLRLLAARFGTVDDAIRARLADASTEQLNAWAERVLTAGAVDDVFAGLADS
jgi:flagellar biosynthesis/type III secretory pathway protein FliH